MKRFFYGVFSLFLIVILAVVIRHPQNNLIPSRIFIYMLIWVLILGVIRWALDLLEGILVKNGRNVDKISRIGLGCYLIVYGIGIYIVSLILQSDPVTDYDFLYHTAYKLATGQAAESWNYFSMWTNNLGSLTILTFCMRLGVCLGFSEPYYFVLGLNVLQLMAVIGSLYYLAGRLGEKSIARQWFAVAVFTLWLPVWACTNAFYTDQLSFGGSVMATALWVYACDLKQCGGSRIKRVGAILLAALVWSVSIVAKATSAIAIVAMAVTFFLVWKKAKTFWKSSLLFLLAILLFTGALSCVSDSYPSKADEYRLKMPLEYWIAMGMIGNGTYADNEDLVQGCYYSQNVEERREFCRQMIRENWKNMFRADHFVEKTAVIFASGEISPTSHIYPRQESLLWHWVYWEGDYYWKYSCLTTAYFYAVLLLMLVGTIYRVFASCEKESPMVFVIYLTIFGLFLFMMLWEAQNKQLYNHISWMTLAVVCGIEGVRTLLTKKTGRTLCINCEKEKQNA